MSEIKKGDMIVDYVAPKARHPWWKYASNGTSQFAFNIVGTPMSIFLYYYYEVILGLNGTLIFLAMSIFMIWNAINDPFLSFVMDRNTRLTKRWGRRFPWMLIGIIPWCLTFYFIFAAPDIDGSTNPWPLFWYLIVLLSLQDTFYVFIGINVGSVRPDLFRTEDERRKLVPWWTGMDIVSTIISMIIGPYLIGSGNSKAAFAFMAAIFGISALLALLLSLPGNWEDKMTKERYFQISQEKEKVSFFTSVIHAFKTKSVMIYLIILAAWIIVSNLLLENSLYINTFILQGNPDDYMIILAVLILAVIVSIPVWLKILKKKGNKYTFSLGGFLIVLALIPITFAFTFESLLIMMGILGFTMGSYWALMYTTIQAIVFDDFGVKYKTSQKAIIFGVIGFITTLFTTIDEGLIALVHNLTGFVPGQETYAEMLAAVTLAGGDINLVLFGIRLLSGIIPALVLFLGVFIFWKYFPLTMEKVIENKLKLKELGL